MSEIKTSIIIVYNFQLINFQRKGIEKIITTQPIINFFLTFQKKNWLHHNLNICHQKVCIHARIHMYKYIKNQFSIE